jgi:2-oxoglutarate ferredoxin oxidoreductase subunit beta
MKYGYEWDDEIPIGLFWKRTDLPSLDQLEPSLSQGGPLARRRLGISPEAAQSLIRELM